jgi:hypothetical protein
MIVTGMRYNKVCVAFYVPGDAGLTAGPGRPAIAEKPRLCGSPPRRYTAEKNRPLPAQAVLEQFS